MTRADIPRELWALIAAAFIIAVGYGIIAPILPQFARSFDVGIGAASMIVSAFALMRMVFAPPSGALVNRFGERNVYVVGVFIVALSTAGCALAQDFTQLLVIRGLGGIGSTMFTIAAMGLIVRIAPPHLRGRVSALYGTAFLSGNIVGPILGTALSGLGYRTPFLIYAGFLFAAAVVAGVLLSRAQLQAREQDARPTLGLREALRHRSYGALLAASFANGWTNFGVRISLVPLFAAAVPTLGVPMAGFGLTAYAVGNFLVLQFAGRLVDRIGRRPVVLLGLVVGGLATIVFGLVTWIPGYLALSALAGAGASLIAPSQQAALADIVGNERAGGQALATMSMVTDLGGFLGPIAAGFLADRLGFGWAFGMTGALMLLAAVPWFLAPETMDRTPQDA